ncbi:MAG: ImmA/IrrE family metallo-endopeptidase [Clostridia bacterium]|nr:ImmA/IrrE family metallo-endopeptidase [Clostridia bacterium]
MLNTLSRNTICNNDLHRIAEAKGARIDYAPLPSAQAVAVKCGERFFIGLDCGIPENSPRERIILAHELGHIETDAFYGIRAPEWVRQCAESTAERWAVKQLVPKAALCALLKQGFTAWELAEHFNVTEAFIQKACYLYFECGMQAK